MDCLSRRPNDELADSTPIVVDEVGRARSTTDDNHRTLPVLERGHLPYVYYYIRLMSPISDPPETTGRCGVVGVVVAGEIGISPQLVTDWDRSTIGVVTTVAKVRRPSKLELHEWIWRVDLVDVLRFVLL